MSTDSEIMRESATTPGAFAEIFDRHAPSVERFLRRRLGAEAAEDALSETFLVAFKKRATYDVSFESARPWLLGIAVRVTARHRGAEARHWRAVAAAASRGEFTTGGGIDEVTGRVDAAAALAELAPRIAALSQKDRDTLLLFAWEGLSQEEIATAMNIPVGTVWSRLNRVRRKLAPKGSHGAIRLTWLGKENGDERLSAGA